MIHIETDAQTLFFLVAGAFISGMFAGTALYGNWLARKFEGLVDPNDPDEKEKE